MQYDYLSLLVLYCQTTNQKSFAYLYTVPLINKFNPKKLLNKKLRRWQTPLNWAHLILSKSYSQPQQKQPELYNYVSLYQNILIQTYIYIYIYEDH